MRQNAAGQRGDLQQQAKTGRNGAWPETLVNVVDADEGNSSNSPNNADYAKAREKGPPFPRAVMPRHGLRFVYSTITNFPPFTCSMTMESSPRPL